MFRTRFARDFLRAAFSCAVVLVVTSFVLALSGIGSKAFATYGTIKIKKVSEGGDGTFEFTGPSDSKKFSIRTTGGKGEKTFSNIEAGVYSVSESVPDGWELKTSYCDNGASPGSISLRVGKTVTCTFENKKIEKQGSIVIIKMAEGGNGKFDFASTALGNFSIQTESGSGQKSFSSLTPGNYAVSEKVPDGWELKKSYCDNGASPGSISLQAGKTITCTFENQKVEEKGSITLVKNAVGGNGTFAFTGSLVSADSSFGSLTTSGGSGAVGPKKLNVGSYTITESALAGWKLTGLKCQGGSVAINAATATIDLKKDETVTCTYENAKDGSLTVSKTVPGGSSQGFGFSGTDPSNAGIAFSLASGGSQTFTGLGKFTITESTLAGWKLTGLTCTGGGIADKASRKIDVDLVPGASVSCVYTNERETGTLIVRKDAIGGDGNFSFSVTGQSNFVLSKGGSKTFTGLAVGSYTIEELAIPAGWDLKSASCGKLIDNKTTVTIADGETVTCVFTNLKEKDDRAEDVTKVFIHRRVDNLLTHGPDRARILRRLEDQDRPGSLKDGGSEALKITGSAGDGQAEATFSTSLSQMRSAAATAANRKFEDAGLALQDSYSSATPSTMKQRLDIWVEGQLTTYDDATGGINRNGDFKILYAGADYAISPGILIGALVQIDRTDEKIDDPSLKGMVAGTGWMMGPYLGVKLRDNLFFDARAAWGQSTNDLELSDDIVGARTGSFETDRWLASASLTGNYQWGGLRVSPQVGVAYGNEVSDSYLTSLGQKVDGVDVAIGRLTFGPEFGYRSTLENGLSIEPHLSVKGIWDFYGDELELSTGPVKPDDFRVQVEGGVTIQTPDGYSFRASGSYDGLGDKDLEAWTAKAGVNIPLR
jgi:outer membrane autotransporter protein